MTLPEPNALFVAGLSNGETLVEGRGKLEKKDTSPWHKLQSYIKENDLEIKSFGIWIGDRHFNLPAMGRFGGEIPLEYNCFRKFSADAAIGKSSVEHHACYTYAEAIFKDYTVQLIVDEFDINKCWINYVQHKDDKKKLQ